VIFSCCSANRRNAILSNPAVTLNGIDYLEVLGPEAVALGGLPQQTLMIHCLKAVSALTTDNVIIEGGESITHIGVVSVATTAAANVLMVITSVAGDFSPYVLRLVGSALGSIGDPFDVTDVLPGFDPQLAEVQFSFQAGLGPSFDCEPPDPQCAPPSAPPPPINYLAKDYGSFRTLILDRLNQLLPMPVGSNEADLAVVLAELIAYRADQLSYQQDAVATEAYIQTARSRVSLRRHARLLGYKVHDGCNARAWVQLNVAAGTGEAVFLDRTLTRFYSYAPGMPATLAVGAGNEEAALQAGVQVFQPMQDALLYSEHNRMDFYTWGDAQCCLPAGSVEATLQGSYPNLQPGDVLIFQEMLGPQTGNAADADLRHRCAVRLTQVAHVDAAGQPLIDPLFDLKGAPIIGAGQTPMPITEIQWAESDALPFAVCVSSLYLDSNGAEQAASGVSAAFGNVVLADHGLSVARADLGIVPAPTLFYPPNLQASRCRQPSAPSPLAVRFRPAIPDSPLTQAVAAPLTGVPASAGAVLLGDGGTAQLPDAQGFISLMAQAANPAGWPALFGISVTANAVNPANFDLAVVYNPPHGAAGVPSPVALERFANLSLKPTDSNYVVTQINGLSELIRVPAGYIPPTKAPSGFPATPTMLVAGAAVPLKDLGSTPLTFLVLQPTPPQGWAAKFGVLAQGLDPAASTFNLAVIYYAPSAIGVTLPVTLEQFTDLSRGTLSSELNSSSRLITVQSFAGAPNLNLAAQDLINVDPQNAVPQITLQGTFDGATTLWRVQADLLASGPSDPVFAVEIQSDGAATARFATAGDPSSPLETNGLVPASGTAFTAGYRIGNGSAGNVGAESLKFLAAADARVQSCINPMPAAGGTDPETNEQIRRRAPQAFLSQAPNTLIRSVTMADYEAVAANNARVNQAMASLRWTGSWYSVFIAVEPVGGGNLTPALQTTVSNTVESYRLAGQDVQLESPQYVSLQIALDVDVDDNYFRSDVEQSLLQALGNQLLPNGRKGLFYPDNFTFGQSVYLSPVYAAARSVAGVVTVTATQFQPQGVNTAQYLSTGEIKLGSLQVARLENDPSFPNHGQLTLAMQGGR
jgi:hypothetical protein